MKYLNLGCGNRFNNGKEWVNIDFTSADPCVKAHNLREGVPLHDNSVDVVYHSHLLEHFAKHEAPVFLSECRRVLKPGGVLRVAVPDLEGITRTYLETLDEARACKEGAEARHEWMIIELIDQMVREKSGGEMLAYLSQASIPAEAFILKRLGVEAKRIIESVRSAGAAKKKRNAPSSYLGRLKGLIATADKGKAPEAKAVAFRRSGEVHRWMYDSLSLKRLIEAAGFTDVARCNADESHIAGWAKETLDTEPDGSVYKPDSLFMEGKKSSV
jgi:predicted SAM-dependent methyltransferase